MECEIYKSDLSLVCASVLLLKANLTSESERARQTAWESIKKKLEKRVQSMTNADLVKSDRFELLFPTTIFHHISRNLPSFLIVQTWIVSSAIV